ncbi:stage III sporulation protein SpoIIIAB [Aceticella autotrophica]|uniref:stage III sporulation protein SpoIIIAB n=1 Tax=Aceticella autotrophica TaxID=2755338 RepID=UPI0025431ADE|nr:stage III sporulation protein SpoIIIAB [Aceticella autotrophica]
MIKIIGMIMILISSTLIGYIISLRYSLRRWTLKCLISSLNMLKTEISYSKTPLSEAFEKISEVSDSSIRFLFSNTAKILNLNEGYTAGEALEISLSKWKDNNFNKDDIEIIKSLGYGLGNSDGYNQENNLELALELLKKQLADAEELGKKNERLYRNLGFLIGVVIVILFI